MMLSTIIPSLLTVYMSLHDFVRSYFHKLSRGPYFAQYSFGISLFGIWIPQNAFFCMFVNALSNCCLKNVSSLKYAFLTFSSANLIFDSIPSLLQGIF